MALASEMMTGGLSAGAAQAINGQVATSVSAAGSTISDATQLVASNVSVGTVSTGQGVILPNGVIGDTVCVFNNTTTALVVYPPTTSQQINQLSAGTGMTLSMYTGCVYRKVTSTRWLAFLSA